MLFWQNVFPLEVCLSENSVEEEPQAITHLWCETSASNVDISEWNRNI